MSMVCLLAGIVTTRPSAFAEGEGFEPPNRLDDCRVSGAVLSASQPTFLAVVSCAFPQCLLSSIASLWYSDNRPTP